MDQKPQGHHTNQPMAMGDDKLCSESLTPVKKMQGDGMQNLDFTLVTPTLEKADETVNMRSKKELIQLPDKYKLLSDFFSSMITSVRVLNLYKRVPIFRDICRHVEIFEKRKFSYTNLAQIMSIIPEAVEIDTISIHNQETLCVEPDLVVTLLLDVVEGHVEPSDDIALYKLFCSRLVEFVNTHSEEEDCDVPLAELPYPFNQRETTVPKPPPVPEADFFHVGERLLEPPQYRKKRGFIDLIAELKSAPPKKTDDDDDDLLASILLHCDTTIITNEDTPMKMKSPSVETSDLSTPKRSVPTEDKQKPLTSSSMFVKRFSDFSITDDENAAACLDQELELEGKTTFPSGPPAKKPLTSSSMFVKRFSDFSITDDENAAACLDRELELEGKTTFPSGPSAKYQQRARIQVHH